MHCGFYPSLFSLVSSARSSEAAALRHRIPLCHVTVRDTRSLMGGGGHVISVSQLTEAILPWLLLSALLAPPDCAFTRSPRAATEGPSQRAVQVPEATEVRSALVCPCSYLPARQ